MTLSEMTLPELREELKALIEMANLSRDPEWMVPINKISVEITKRLKTLKQLQELFPVRPRTCAVTGFIPMEFVNANLKVIAAIVKEHHLTRRYRGPRQKQSMLSETYREHTLKADAVAMVLYRTWRSKS